MAAHASEEASYFISLHWDRDAPGLVTFSPFSGVNPFENRYLVERVTEFVVIVALMGAGRAGTNGSAHCCCSEGHSALGAIPMKFVILSALALTFAVPAIASPARADVIFTTHRHHHRYFNNEDNSVVINQDGQRLHHRHHGQLAFYDHGRRHHHRQDLVVVSTLHHHRPHQVVIENGGY
jgi:hypothetical protein